MFTPERLRRLGEWCVDRLGGGDFSCEDVTGGLLVVDRSTTAPRRWAEAARALYSSLLNH
jgi:hypothetical protein